MKNNKNFLRSHGLKSTVVRLETLKILQESDKALSHSELENLFPDFDRVTLYRTLHAFDDKGIIHRIIDKNGGVKYSACAQSCDHSIPHDQHLHFSCTSCDSTQCINEVETQAPKLPAGYQMNNFFTLAIGICPQCSQ